ncbi:hypothetical protein RN001_013895 [Aquatica leii]|uniref:Ig-like domain-containing protein n=1 Tax=Aquatica leii TaxID=1421715 RepID=A0AAN7Q095_9COLE|nr:hypothetical protein RN001_013895 [Aquatica leii]
MPSFAYIGDSITIECSVDLGRLLATSISFFKNNTEIYKWSRTNDRGNPFSFFPTAGVSFDTDKQKYNEIELINIETETSGNYSCRVKINHAVMNYVELSGSLSVLSRKS